MPNRSGNSKLCQTVQQTSTTNLSQWQSQDHTDDRQAQQLTAVYVPSRPHTQTQTVLSSTDWCWTVHTSTAVNQPTCLMAERRLFSGSCAKYLSGTSPPSPVLLLAPSLFIAIASVVWVSYDILPKLIAPTHTHRGHTHCHLLSLSLSIITITRSSHHPSLDSLLSAAQ